MLNIQFFNHDRSPNLRNKIRLKTYIFELFKKKKKKILNISYIFCSDKHILEINRTFLKHDYYTDVISFNLSESQKEIQAEVYISIDRVKENAFKEKESFKKELHRVIFHGSLHLCGYNDKKEGDKAVMKKAENKYLNKYFN